MTAHKFVPGDQRQADESRRVATRVTPADPRSAGLDGGVGGPTPSQRDTVRASLFCESRAEVYRRRIPGSPRHA
jgi:hypothetical protein